jgi:DNA polymerase-3 subunit alpha
MSNFVHLHTHSEYSLLDGLSKPRAMAERASALGQKAMAITDHGNMHGAIIFYDACHAAGIKPIIGCEVYTAEAGDKDAGHLILLAADSTGYRNLNQIVSQASLTNFYRKPRVSREMLASWREGIIVLSGCLRGDLAQAIINGGDPIEVARWYRDIFGDRYYIEVHDHGIPAQAIVKQAAVEIARTVRSRIVVAQDSHFVMKGDGQAHEMLLAVQTGARLSDPGRFKFEGTGFHITSEAEMLEAWPREWIEESGRIADRCDLKLELGKQVFPKTPGVGDDEHGTLRGLAYAGAQERYGSLAHKERLDYELETISRNGFTRYFLIVADICRYARSVGIRNSARGSVGGSLVAYCLGIVPVDPMRFGLSFERFLNDGRSPDIDLDFEDARRGEIIQYIAATYGHDKVAQIVTFSEIGGRTALRDVGRALGIGSAQIDVLAKSVPLGRRIEEALESPALKAIEGSDLMRYARRLEGTIRHAGKHAAGVVVADRPLVERATLMRDSAGVMPMVGIDMASAERAGLIKFDLLGLKTLSTVSRAVDLIEERHGPMEPSIDRIPEDETRVWEMLGRGDSVGVFQVESPGMRRVLKEMKPARVEHLQAAVALYRPGPMDSIKPYCERRHGREQATYLHPALEPVLRDTYGLVVYQEAIMQIANRVAGMTPYESDQFLGAVRKKNPEKLRIYEPKFKAGLEAAGLSREQIDKLWAEIVPFANYGFNQAHAAAYGWLAYQTAWLKAVWPQEYYTALLTQDSADPERMAIICHDARRLGVKIHGPSVNESLADFSVASGGGIRFGLAAIKYVGVAAREAIVAARAGGRFTSVEDFRGRVTKRAVNSRALESLAKAGAFDCLGNRRHVLAALGIEAKDMIARLSLEREVMGLAVSADPLAAWDFVALGRDTTLAEVGPLLDEELSPQCVVAGELMERRDITTKTGKPMAIMMLRDETATVRLSAFREAIGRSGHVLVPGKIIMALATPDRWQGEDSLLLSQAWEPDAGLDMETGS